MNHNRNLNVRDIVVTGMIAAMCAMATAINAPSSILTSGVGFVAALVVAPKLRKVLSR